MKDKLKNYIPILIMLLLALVILVLFLTGRLNIGELIRAVENNKAAAFSVILGLYILKGFSFGVPYAAIAIGSAAVFGTGPAIAINALGTALCLTASYLIGRYSKKVSLERVMQKHPKLAPYFRNAENSGMILCFTTHALHLQMEAQGVIYGIVRTDYGKYITGSMLAMLPQFLCYTVIGDRRDLTDPAVLLFLGLDIILIISGLLLAKKKIFK